MDGNFETFHETCRNQLKEIMQELYQAPTPPPTEAANNHLRHLVIKANTLYNEYYRVKAIVAEQDVLALFTTPWDTSLERALRWIAGWRPTIIFHLVYTESTAHLESHIIKILRGYRTGDLGNLSAEQLRFVSELQCETVREENSINEEMSAWYDGAADQVGSEVSHGRLRRLAEIVRKADELRLRSVTKIVEMLTPQQAVQFIVAASELMFSIRGWGDNEDNRRILSL